MLYWNQLEGDNIKMPGHSGKGTDVEGLGLELAPGYNQDSGFPDGETTFASPRTALLTTG